MYVFSHHLASEEPLKTTAGGLGIFLNIQNYFLNEI
jgi:hypothetical protein